MIYHLTFKYKIFERRHLAKLQRKGFTTSPFLLHIILLIDNYYHDIATIIMGTI